MQRTIFSSLPCYTDHGGDDDSSWLPVVAHVGSPPSLILVAVSLSHSLAAVTPIPLLLSFLFFFPLIFPFLSFFPYFLLSFPL